MCELFGRGVFDAETVKLQVGDEYSSFILAREGEHIGGHRSHKLVNNSACLF